jgi:outer membrane receptor protein involved in Fe transport
MRTDRLPAARQRVKSKQEAAMLNEISTNSFNRGAVLVAAMLLAFSASAQDSDAEAEVDEKALEEVIVTGTHIAGVDEAVLPVTVMGAEAIEATGAISMGEVLSYIPSISDLEFEDNSNGTNSARGYVCSVALRGLPSAYTLPLINGRRMVIHPTFQAQNSVPSTFGNVCAIPSAAVERVEVLRDGAAPLYGADAIAGVVNVVTHSSYDGIRLSGRYDWGDNTSYDQSEVTAAGGWDFNDGRTNVSLFASWYERSNVHMNELDDLYYNLDRRENPRIPESWQGDSQLRNTSTLTPYARFRVGSLRDDGIFVGDSYHVDGGTGAIESGGGSERYNFNEDAWVTPEDEVYSFLGSFTHEFDGGMQFFADGYYTQTDSRIIRAASPLDDSLAFLIVPADSFHNPFDEDVLLLGWRPVDLGPRIIDTENEQWSLTTGLRGDWSGWDWEAALVYSEAENKDTESNRQAKSLFTAQVMVDGPDALNPFVGPGGNSQAALDGIRVAATDVRTSSLTMADLRVNRGDLFGLFGNDVGAAFGVEWRNEDYFDDRDPRLDGSMPFDTGAIFDESDLIGVSATFDSGASRDTYSAYGEFNFPLIGAANEAMIARSLEVQLAARYENPDDFDSTFKPKIGFRWEPTEGLLFRGNYTQGFKAPNLPQMNQGDIIRRIDGIEDPMRADVTGRPIDTGDTYRRTTRLGNPDLQPQDSETWMVGVVFSPTWAGEWASGLRISLDWWRIEIEDEITLDDEELQLEIDQQLRESGVGFNPNVIRADITADDQAAFDAWNAANPGDQRLPVGEAVDIIGMYRNADRSEVEGWDGSLVWVMPETRAGQFTFRTDFTYITNYSRDIGLAQTDLLRRNGNPEWRYTAGLDWAYQGFRANVNMRYVSEVYDSSLTQSTSIEGPGIVVGNTKYWQVDEWRVYNVMLGYDFSRLGDRVRGFDASIGIRNLTDEDAPFADESFGYFTRLHNTYGRVYWARLGYRF